MSEPSPTRTLVLPYLVAGRDLADAMLEPLEPLAGTRFVVDGRSLATGSVSFASQLVVRVLDQGGAGALVLVGGPQEFVEHVCGAAERLGVADRLTVTASDLAVVASA